MSEATQQKISLKDFKSWLQGVEDMQEEGWTPSPTQWKKIREKIDQIQETVITVPQSPQPYQPATPQPWSPPYIVTATDSHTNTLGHAPKMSQFQPIHPPPPPINTESGLTTENTKTPNIDTSDGKYNTSFL